MTNAALLGADQRLHNAVEATYRAFDGPLPAVIEGCPCCIGTRKTDILLTTPLRQLTGQDLWRYVSGAFLTVGGQEDFRYLLPRILEVAVSDPGNSNDPEIVLGKLQLADWQGWPPNQRQAIEEFVDAWFERALAGDIAAAKDGWSTTDAESVLCGAATAGMPLKRWLVRLHEPDAVSVLASMQARYPEDISPFWEDAPAGLQEMSAILIQGAA